MKSIIALLLAVTACAVHAAEEPDVYPCLQRSSFGYIQCNGGIKGYERVMYQDDNGSTKVANVLTSYVVQCKGGICNDESDNFVGEAADDKYSIRRGYYIGWGADQKIYAYRNGIGPGFGGSAYTPTAAPVSAGDACYEGKIADFRKENGEDAMVIMDQIHEWQTQCGLPISY